MLSMVTYNILNPHPKIQEKYDESGLSFDEIGFASAAAERKFFASVADVTDDRGKKLNTQSKTILHKITAAKELADNPIERKIVSLYRAQDVKGDEYIYFVELLKGKHRVTKNQKTHHRIVGIYNDITIKNQINLETGALEAQPYDIETDSMPTYEIPFAGGVDPSTGDDIKPADLKKYVDNRTQFYIVYNEKKFGVPVSFEDLTTRSFADLVEFEKTRKWQTEAKVKSK